MRPVVPALAAILLLGVAPAVSQDAPPSPGPVPASEAPVRCIVEEECLDQLRGIASRDGDTLTLNLRDGRKRVFRDDRQACAEVDGERCAVHRLSAYAPASGAYVIEREGSETGGAILVDIADGTETALAATPEFSPSGRRLVVVDPSGEGRAYDVAVYALKEGRWTDETQFLGMVPNEDEVWSLVSWNGEDRIRLTYAVPADGGREERVRMFWDGGGWQVLRGWDEGRP